MKKFVLHSGKLTSVYCLLLFLTLCGGIQAQDDSSYTEVKPVPVLTGSTAYFTRVNGGQVQDAPTVSPLLLLPIGDHLLIESKAGLSDTFVKNAQGDYAGTVSYGLSYAQADYITKYATFTGGRFVTPFNMYGERLTPNWIRDLQTTPMSVGITSGAALGGMVRGGLPLATDKIHLNYATYFSTANTNHILATDRSTGGRIGFFFPGPRLEIGASFQQVLQLDRPHAVGTHFEWQPNAFPLTLRSEYTRSSGTRGSGYWIEAAYRLSQIPHMGATELVGRGQQFFAASNLAPAVAKKLGSLGLDTNEGDWGLNYYFRSDVRASASYGRQFALGRNANLWTIGMTYRFVMPMWPTGGGL
ncbi:MAG TPA: hypothetical protein VJV96_02495 [Candidatus Angelobacter sp.]|nr:hypothetical protein [Candidatus Angelobacter sp.]